MVEVRYKAQKSGSSKAANLSANRTLHVVRRRHFSALFTIAVSTTGLLLNLSEFIRCPTSIIKNPDCSLGPKIRFLTCLWSQARWKMLAKLS